MSSPMQVYLLLIRILSIVNSLKGAIVLYLWIHLADPVEQTSNRLSKIALIRKKGYLNIKKMNA